MLTIRQVREVVAGLIHQLPEAPLPPSPPEQFFGSDQTLEATIAAHLAVSLANIEDWPSRLTSETIPPMKMRLMFAAECLRQMEEASPDELIPGAAIPPLLHDMLIVQWPQHGKAWAIATFGPRRRMR